jgi:ATP-dependent helicase HrpA
LTTLGHFMAKIPLDPRISRMLIEAQKERCISDILVIAAALSIQDPQGTSIGKSQRRLIRCKPGLLILL